ncbi:VirB8/TrbF family protein [Microbulbifer aggregans]|uniref:VirB8/TrbF family protein n=1 Tax=Microbulbifer aggregans TaxID=1769779 RepID=UPI001CFDC20F|nr:VirB8/TrbF family protein [Microbulbifer aggregans]
MTTANTKDLDSGQDKQPRKGKGSVDMTPYLQARREWDARYGDYIKQRDQWRLTAVSSLLGLLLCIVGLIYISSQNKLVPYLVEIDKLGRVANVQPVEKVGQVDMRIVRAQLASWVTNTRSVTSDAEIQKRQVWDSYALINNADPSAVLLNTHFRDEENNPFKRAGKETVEVNIRSVLPQTKDSWEAEWEEVIKSRKGQVIGRQYWRALLQVYTAQPDNEKAIFTNPTGLYIKEFSWTEQR